MERVVFKFCVFGGGYGEVVVKGGIVCYYDCLVVVVFFYFFVYYFEDGMQGIVFVDGFVLWVMWVNFVKSQCFGLQIGVFERFNMEMQCFIGYQLVVFIYF